MEKYICENCGNEHDGSYGSGRFCTLECKNSYVAKQTLHRHKPPSCKRQPAKYGTWKCRTCGKIFDVRAQLYEHRKNENHNGKGLKLSEEHKEKIRKSVNKAVIDGRLTGYASTPEKEALKRQRQREAALKRTTSSVCKRTEPYTCVDGSIVNLDSSYERVIAKILDEHKIKWNRPKPLIWIDKKNVQHHYFPDFYLIEYDVYLDPKNEYCFEVQKEKIDYVKEHYSNCFFLTEKQLTWKAINKIIGDVPKWL